MTIRSLAAALAASVALPIGAAHATDLEVTHWWTSGGEAAAVAEFAKAFDATGNKWVDGAIAGSGSTARPIMISRITGGDPMGATQFNHGRQAEELVEAGLMRDLTDVADRGQLDRGRQPAVAARVLHARRQDLLRAGQHPLLAVAVAVEQGLRGRRACRSRPTGTSSSPPRRRSRRPARSRSRWASSPGRRRAPSTCMILALGGTDLYNKIFVDKDAEAAAGPEMAEIWKAADDGAQDGGEVERPGLEPGDQPGHHRPGRRPDHGRLGAGRVPGRRRGRRDRLHLPARPRRQRRCSAPPATPSTSR